ncbi:hypothetical protein [Streptomyces mirabilis]|uniref:hypothetical protein n=1 Tax=Streptomyces mirabilis TaxID=68239 RepID=UPI003697BD4B
MTTNSKGPAPVRGPIGSAASGSTAAASTVRPEDVATLALEYRDGQPVIVVSGGTAIPAGIKMVDASGKPITVDTAVQPRNSYGSFHTGDSYIVLNTYKPRPDSDKLAYDVHFWLGTYATDGA